MDNKIKSILQKITKNESFLSYEVVPQKSFSLNKTLESIKKSKLNEIFDCYICTDSPLARLKHSSILASIKIQNYLNKPTICTISTRDKNSIALQGEIMGLNEFNIRIFLALSGDPIKLGDQPQAKAVFESNSCIIFDIINNLNQNKDLQNKSLIDSGKKIYHLGVINSYANNMENIYKKMYKKIQKGAIALITQPVYSIDNIKELLYMIDKINKELKVQTSIIFGYYPISSLKTALFLYNKLPGCYIPDIWINELKSAGDNEERVGIELSKNLYKEINNIYPKIHFMCANKISLAESILLN
ncbi:methylenetetrahydrofolate reductase [Helicobacter sp. MIT 14-3879]|uniref:methylenetetrahydrofolate reductase n=1 Tax=Helicobacter sp. MIT 14-3879 TaxID=2040649 RepID=UPI000E1E83E1|nr:methylenetetrahydrofolate reductase [Helicobacter sp. MIT 14-3879]RDU62256.1 5,10-methylenetetrahydrofolate reductase [Helicobacter sp. MIT 14-3879]